jgi:flavin reductase (DIM6/NTAB) family NADH-FMN oxidoreductase RutF
MNVRTDLFTVETLNKLKNLGLLIVGTSKAGKSNVMTIGWGFIGTIWRTPIFIIAVRPTRYTHKFIEETNEFTVNVPTEDMDKIVETCGTVSGRKTDKIKECKLTLKKAKKIKTPIIKQCRIHYECQVVHKLKINPKQVPPHIKQEFYPKLNYHILYFGKILAIY